MRRLNKEKMNEWLTIQGELAHEDLASLARIRFHTVKRIVEGTKVPSELEQLALCKATGLTIDELFPLLKQKEKIAG